MVIKTSDMSENYVLSFLVNPKQIINSFEVHLRIRKTLLIYGGTKRLFF